MRKYSEKEKVRKKKELMNIWMLKEKKKEKNKKRKWGKIKEEKIRKLEEEKTSNKYR